MAVVVSIILSPKEKALLERNTRSRKTSMRLQERSRIILLASEGFTNGISSSELRMGKNNGGRWRKCYADMRHTGIEKDRPRGNNQGGKPSIEQARLRNRVIEMTMKPP